MELAKALRPHYGQFLSHERILLTGHSHQAWPDCAQAGQLRYFETAARLVDQKWGREVLPKGEAVGRRILARFGFDEADPIAFGGSTHELVFRWLSAYELRGKRLVTTSGEFHSLHRQLRRLEEEGLEVEWVPAYPADTLAERLGEALQTPTHLLAVSSVLFETSTVVPGLAAVLEHAQGQGVDCLVDAYHGFNALPLEWPKRRDRLYAVAGGYKYAQFGEGLCWLRFPQECSLRPVYTGWFADFGALEAPREGQQGTIVGYAQGSARFGGATFDGSALYRAEAVLDFFDAEGLSVECLRACSLAQTGRLQAAFEALDLPPDVAQLATPTSAPGRGAFVAVRTPHAGKWHERLLQQGVWTDYRGELLRFGPAPYTLNSELDRAMGYVAELAKGGA